MKELAALPELIVRQKKEWGEILTGFESRNKYVLQTASGQDLFLAGEESNLLLRLLFKAMRPLTIHVLSPQGTGLLKLEKPFHFFFPDMSVVDAPSGAILGTVKCRFKIIGRLYTVYDAQGREIFSIHGPFFHPWTFHIKKDGAEAGLIEKKWSGLGKEMFSDADNFRVSFPAGADPAQKAALLGALFLIDLAHFERK